MRDILVVALVFGSIPFILYRPWIGILVWSWLGYMNPHRLTWNFAFDFPFAQIIGVITLVAIVFSKEKKRFPISALTVVWILWIFWLNVTTYYALFPSFAEPEWDRAMKIQLFAIVTVMVMRQRERVDALMKANLSCSANSDCVRVGTGTGCAGACPRAVNKTGEPLVKAAVAEINQSICKDYRLHNCPYLSPSCAGGITPRCDNNVCKLGS